MLHIASLWETTSIDTRGYFSEIVHRSGRWRRGATVLGAKFAFEAGLVSRFVGHQVTVTPNNRFLVFGVHVVSKDPDSLNSRPKMWANGNRKRGVGEDPPGW